MWIFLFPKDKDSRNDLTCKGELIILFMSIFKRILKVLSTEDNQTKDKPNKPQPLENGDFYYENGFMVFTEQYHKKRGTCCGNACRHCPYDHENVVKR